MIAISNNSYYHRVFVLCVDGVQPALLVVGGGRELAALARRLPNSDGLSDIYD